MGVYLKSLFALPDYKTDINSVNDGFSVSTFPSNFPVWTTGKLDEFLVLDGKLVLNLYQTSKSRLVSAHNVEKRLGWKVSYFFVFIRPIVFVSYDIVNEYEQLEQPRSQAL